MLSDPGISAVPAADSAANATTRDVVGNKTDTVAGTSLVSLALQALGFLQGGAIPDHISQIAPGLAVGQTLTGAAGAWTLGALAEVLAAGGAPAGPYTVDEIILDTPSALQIGAIELYHGAADTPCGRAKYEILTAVGSMPVLKIHTGIIPGGSRVRAALATAAGGAQTINATIRYHVL
jgi:hypothetical protein